MNCANLQKYADFDPRLQLDVMDPKQATGLGHPGFELTLSHQDLGLLLGTTRESVTRVLDRLSRDGIISVNRRCIEVLRPEGLRRLLEQ